MPSEETKCAGAAPERGAGRGAGEGRGRGEGPGPEEALGVPHSPGGLRDGNGLQEVGGAGPGRRLEGSEAESL